MNAGKHLCERKARAGRRLGRKRGANFEPLRGPIRTECYALLQRAIRQHGPHLGILALEGDIDFQQTTGPLEAARQHDGTRHGLREAHAQLHAYPLIRNRWREATRNGARAMAKHRLARRTDPRLRVRRQFKIGHARRQHRAPRAAVLAVNVGHPTRQELHVDRAIADGRIIPMLQSQVREIRREVVVIDDHGATAILPNDTVIVRIGGEAPSAFLEKIGVRIVAKDLPVPRDVAKAG
jgi:hypothetical protein